MKIALFLLTALLFTGCTRIAVVKPVGAPVAAKDTAELAGEWTGPKRQLVTVTIESGELPLKLAYFEKGKPKERRATVTSPAKDVIVLWLKDDELSAFIPLRVSMNDDALALLYPDKTEIEKLIAAGTIKGVYDKDHDSLVLQPDGIQALLATKSFWHLDAATPFTKNK